MCHSEIPPGQVTPSIASSEIEIGLTTGEAMPALLAAAETAGEDAPGVVIAVDMFGRTPFYEHLAALLAEAGFQALLPDYFFRQGPLTEGGKEAAVARRGKLDETQSLDDLGTAATWLRERSGRDEVGVVGFCMGGTFALDLASTRRDLVTVAYYGFPTPQASLASPPPRPIDLVDSLHGPVLAFWGDQDDVVGTDHVDEYVARAAASSASFEHEIVPGAAHGFLGSADLGDERDPAARTWTRAVDHLRRHLGGKES